MAWRGQSGASRLHRRTLRAAGAYLRASVTYNFGLKLLSIAAAFAVWFFVNVSERDAEKALQIAVEKLNRPANLIDVSPRVDFVAVRVSGPRVLLNGITQENLAFTLDLKDVRPGPASFKLQAESLDLPRGVKVVMLTPSEITLEFARLVRRSVPVRVAYSGKPSGELRIVETRVTPESVEVTGPEGHVERMKNVETAPIDLSKASAGSIERNVELEQPREYMTFSASAVHVEILLEEPEATRVLKNLPIVVRNTEYRTSVTPEKAQVTVRGPRSVVQSLELIQGAVYIDASERAPGQYDVTPAADLPAALEVVRWDPPTVRLQVRREKRKKDGN